MSKNMCEDAVNRRITEYFNRHGEFPKELRFSPHELNLFKEEVQRNHQCTSCFEDSNEYKGILLLEHDNVIVEQKRVANFTVGLSSENFVSTIKELRSILEKYNINKLDVDTITDLLKKAIITG